MTRVDSPDDATSVDEPREVVATVVPVIPVTVDDDAINDASHSTAPAPVTVLTDDTEDGEDEVTSDVASTPVVEVAGVQVDTIEPVGDTDSGIDSLIHEALRADDRETWTLVKGDGCNDEDVDEKGEMLALVANVTGALTGTVAPNLPDSA